MSATPFSAVRRASFHCIALACMLPGVVGAQNVSGTQTAPTSEAGISTPSANREMPARLVKLPLKSLGAFSPLRLQGVEGNASVDVGVRLDETVEWARLHLIYTASPALLPGLSHIKIILNDEVLQTVKFDKDRLVGTPQEISLDLDTRYFSDFNRLRFQLIGHYTMECEQPGHTSLWASISNESRLDLKLRQLPLSNDLALLPAPFFDGRDNQMVALPFAFPAQPSAGLLKAAGAMSSWIGAQAAYRGVRFPVSINALPAGHAVVIASNAQRPDWMRDVAEVKKPTLRIMDHPKVHGAKLLLVLGADDAQVQKAADALALGRAGMSGASMEIGALDDPPLRSAYDAPRWVSPERPVTLASLVQYPSELQVQGAALSDSVNVTMRMAPDLFTWNAKGVPLDLKYRYTPTNFSDQGSLSLSINNQFVRAFPLKSSAADHEQSQVLLPLFDDSTLQAKADVRVPAFLIGGDNQLQFLFQIPSADNGRCQSLPQPQLRAAIDPQSTIDLRGFHHYLAMPSMSAFVNSGFPFTKYADLSQTAVVLSSQPTSREIELFLTTLGRMGISTGLAATRFTVLTPAQIDQARDKDVLVLASAQNEEVMQLLQQWQQHLPAVIDRGKRSFRRLNQTLNSVQEWFNLETGVHINTPDGLTMLEGTGAVAAINGFESRLGAQRTVIQLTASEDDALSLLSAALNDPSRISKMRGDLTLVREPAVESFRINPVYYVGSLPWWKQGWFYLHTHPFMLALAGIGSGLLLAFLIFLALRVRARKRLDTGARA